MDTINMGMQLLSNIPPTLPLLQKSNNYGSSLVHSHPTRFGFLAAIPTDNGESALQEAIRALDELHADGIAVTACYNGYWLSNPDLANLWDEINRRGETVHVHPNAYDKGSMGRPAPLVDVAFESAKGVVEMLYSGMLERWPDIKWIM
jgi:predicted TIM-barrel fold metal-dependent hydrolase